MKFAELKRAITGGRILPCYLIKGDDRYVIGCAAAAFHSLLGDFRELNSIAFGGTASPGDIIAALLTPPMLTERRVISVTDYSGDPAPIIDYLKNPYPTSILLLITPSAAAEKALKGHVEIVDCDRLDGPYLTEWVRKKGSARGKTVTAEAARMLVDYCCRDMNRIVNELEKLLDYTEDGEINADTVRTVVSPDIEYKVYELGNAISERSPERTAKLTAAMLDGGESPTALLGMLFKHFRRLLFVSLNPMSDTIAGDLGVKEGAIRIYMKQAARFTQRRLKEIFDKLCAFDAAVKSGEMNEKNALITFVCTALCTAK